MFRFYIFSLKWLWHNRNWTMTRQKLKALDKAWMEHEKRKK